MAHQTEFPDLGSDSRIDTTPPARLSDKEMTSLIEAKKDGPPAKGARTNRKAQRSKRVKNNQKGPKDGRGRGGGGRN